MRRAELVLCALPPAPKHGRRKPTHNIMNASTNERSAANAAALLNELADELDNTSTSDYNDNLKNGEASDLFRLLLAERRALLAVVDALREKQHADQRFDRYSYLSDKKAARAASKVLTQALAELAVQK